MKALITGGGGFLGLAIGRKLRAQGVSVRSFSRHEHPALSGLGIEHRSGDLANAEAVVGAARGCDVIFHVAAKAGVWGPYKEYYQANVEGTENIIQACLKLGIRRLVHTSSPSVVFNGQDMEGVDESVPYPAHFEAFYPETKALAEQRIRAANSPRLTTVALRPLLIWGPGDNHLLPRLAQRARAGQLRRIGHRNTRVDTVHVDNAADAHLLAAQRATPDSAAAGQVYFISQDEPVDTWWMVNQLLAAVGAPAVTRSIPAPAALALAWIFETVHRLAHRPGEPRLTRFVVRELCTSHWFNITAAQRDLGYRPAIAIPQGLTNLRESLR